MNAVGWVIGPDSGVGWPGRGTIGGSWPPLEAIASPYVFGSSPGADSGLGDVPNPGSTVFPGCAEGGSSGPGPIGPLSGSTGRWAGAGTEPWGRSGTDASSGRAIGPVFGAGGV
jgi:hypothetical protein